VPAPCSATPGRNQAVINPRDLLVVDIKIAGHYEAERLLGLHASKSDNAKS
jgi:hypothetical protein